MNDAIDRPALEWMPKEIWGPLKWRELHARAAAPLSMQDEEKWFELFVRGLPCQECRQHFETFIQQHNPDFSTREKFFNWTIRAHNHVNLSLGKPAYSAQEAASLHAEIISRFG